MTFCAAELMTAWRRRQAANDCLHRPYVEWSILVSWILNLGSCILEQPANRLPRILDSGFWMLDAGWA